MYRIITIMVKDVIFLSRLLLLLLLISAIKVTGINRQVLKLNNSYYYINGETYQIIPDESTGIFIHLMIP